MPQRAAAILDELGVHDRALPLPTDKLGDYGIVGREAAHADTLSQDPPVTSPDETPIQALREGSSEKPSPLVLSDEQSAESSVTAETSEEPVADKVDLDDKHLDETGLERPTLSSILRAIPPIGQSIDNMRARAAADAENTASDTPEDAEDSGEENEDRPSEAPSVSEAAQTEIADVNTAESSSIKEFAAHSPAQTPKSDSSDPTEIGALVERIEAFSKARNDRDRSAISEGVDHTSKLDRAPRLPLDEYTREAQNNKVQSFVFAMNLDGKIDWCEAPIAPMIIGTDLLQLAEPASPILGRFRARQPIRGAQISLAGAHMIAGDWIIDATPRFTRRGGSFTGYTGRFRRSRSNADQEHVVAEAEKLRQLLHELRTPVTAIQGFAEVIQQQLFGATPHEYRALAATIAGDSARMLAGFDELDRLVKLESRALELAEGMTDFAPIAKAQVEQLQSVLTPRVAGFAVEWPDRPMTIAIDHAECEMIAWRIFATLGSAVGAGETLTINFVSSSKNDEGDAKATMTLSCGLPASMISAADIFAPNARVEGNALTPGIFGAGFALRLARAEVRSIGGDLLRDEDALIFTLPLQGLHALTAPNEAISPVKRPNQAVGG
jgi:signal transduction histidine kinase